MSNFIKVADGVQEDPIEVPCEEDGTVYVCLLTNLSFLPNSVFPRQSFDHFVITLSRG